MRPHKIEIPNWLPEGISRPEFYQDPSEVRRVLIETGFNEMSYRFFEKMLKISKAQPLFEWLRWEGYFAKNDDSQDLAVVGVLHFHGQLFVRLMLVRAVPNDKVAPAEDAMQMMMSEYLEQLRDSNRQNN
jgi:hypothetical protein